MFDFANGSAGNQLVTRILYIHPLKTRNESPNIRPCHF